MKKMKANEKQMKKKDYTITTITTKVPYLTSRPYPANCQEFKLNNLVIIKSRLIPNLQLPYLRIR